MGAGVTPEELLDVAPSRFSLAAAVADNAELLGMLNYYCIFDPLNEIVPEDTDKYQHQQNLCSLLDILANRPLNSEDSVFFHGHTTEIYKALWQIYRIDGVKSADRQGIADVLPISKERMITIASK